MTFYPPLTLRLSLFSNPVLGTFLVNKLNSVKGGSSCKPFQAGTFTLDTSGFALLDHESKVSDFRDKSQPRRWSRFTFQKFRNSSSERLAPTKSLRSVQSFVREIQKSVQSFNPPHQTFTPINPQKVRNTDSRQRSFHDLTNPISNTHASSASISGVDIHRSARLAACCLRRENCP